MNERSELGGRKFLASLKILSFNVSSCLAFATQETAPGAVAFVLNIRTPKLLKYLSKENRPAKFSYPEIKSKK